MAREAVESQGVRSTVTAGGRSLEVEWIGPPPEAAPTLVFLHDGLGCVDTWRDVPAALAAATGCGALVYSRAGYGGSEGLPGPWPVRSCTTKRDWRCRSCWRRPACGIAS